jgi:hypothetical protein
MTRIHLRLRTLLPAFAAACLVATSPVGAMAGQDSQKPAQPAVGKTTVVVEQVENGSTFGAEVKYTQVNDRDAVLLGGYAGAVFDNTLLIGGAGYWQVNSDYYHGGGGYHVGMGYGGALLEWYALRSPAIAISVRGLIGGGVSTVSVPWNGYTEPHASFGHHGPPTEPRPPTGSTVGYYVYDQGFFIAEPQLNVTVRIAHGVALVGGVSYRVIGAANGFEDQIGGLTGTATIRFGGGR